MEQQQSDSLTQSLPSGKIQSLGNKTRLKGFPTGDHVGIDVKRVVDGVDGSLPEVPLAEGQGTPVGADAQHVGVPAQ